MTMRIAHRATSRPYSVRRLMRADERAILDIIESVRRELSGQRRTQSLLDPSDANLYTRTNSRTRPISSPRLPEFMQEEQG